MVLRHTSPPNFILPLNTINVDLHTHKGKSPSDVLTYAGMESSTSHDVCVYTGIHYVQMKEEVMVG